MNLRLTLVVAGLALLSISQDSRAIKPNHKYARTPASLGIAYDSLDIPTGNRQRVTAWYCHSKKDTGVRKVIVLASADAGNMADNLDIVSAIVTNLPADVIMFDYRGFGTSDPIVIDTDLIAMPQFSQDLRSVMSYVRANFVAEGANALVYGRSMGASLALAIASQFEDIGGIVAESPYVTQAALKQYYTAEYKRMHSKRKVKVIESNLLEPMDTSAVIACPVLLIHGELEKAITSKEIDALFATIKSDRKVLWNVPNADHMQAPIVDASEFLTKLSAFGWPSERELERQRRDDR